jgi:HlyD family secretion protein
VLVRLPDPKRMQVKAKIAESLINQVRPGEEVIVSLEALPGVTIRGKVVRMNEFPEPEQWMGPSVKQYQATISLQSPPEGLRPGLTADLAIRVRSLPSELQVPVSAIVKHDDEDYCVGLEDGRLAAHKVTLGPSNGRFVIIRDGLEEGREGVLGASAYREKLFPSGETSSPADDTHQPSAQPRHEHIAGL